MSTQCLYQCPCVSCYLRLRQPMLFIQNGAFCSLFDYAHASAYAHVSACPHAHAHTHVSFPNVSAYAHDLPPSPLANLFVDSFANCYSLRLVPIQFPFLTCTWFESIPVAKYGDCIRQKKRPFPVQFPYLATGIDSGLLDAIEEQAS